MKQRDKGHYRDLFSFAPCKVIALNLLCFIYGIIFFASVLIALYKVIALPTIAIAWQQRLLFLALNAFKGVKERNLYGKQHRKETKKLSKETEGTIHRHFFIFFFLHIIQYFMYILELDLVQRIHFIHIKGLNFKE